MDGPSRGHGQGHTGETSVEMEQTGTLYIPKDINIGNGTRTLIRRRRTSSKRRSSSRRRHERENLDDLLNEEDNHLLPSLRFQRRTMLKSMKDRRVELQEEKIAEKSPSFRTRYQDLKTRDAITTGNLAEIVRDSTLRRHWLGEWSRPNKRDRFSRWSREFFDHFRIWVTSFKVIEGKFGTAVMSFFKFLRWLTFLNILLMVIMFFVITVPFLALKKESFVSMVNVSESAYHHEAVNCSQEYQEYSREIMKNESTFEKVLDFLQGTGWMERTILFYGHYHNKTYVNSDGEERVYNMGLAYILAIGTCFLISFLLIINNSARTVKATFGIQSSVAAFSNRVFGGWDYAISNAKGSKIKKRNVLVDLKDSLAEDRRQEKIAQRSSNDNATLFFKRCMVNGFVLAILVGALYLVYFTTDKLLKLQENQHNEIVALIIQYLPYLTITVLNFAIPLIFQKIVLFEEYSQNTALWVTLLRSILLRLASLGVLIGSLYRLLIDFGDGSNQTCGNRLWRPYSVTRGSIKCWETYVGQQIYKLVLLDLLVETSIIIFMQLPRRLLYDRYGGSVTLIKKLGPQAFDLPQNVIDIIYTQTLCWLGMFFSPLIPFITFSKCVIFFYLRKWTLLKNCSQEEQMYRTSRSKSLFMFVLLLSFILATVPVGYMISSISPSQSCGPFRIYTKEGWVMFDTLSVTIRSWPKVIRDIALFIGTIGFLLPVVILLLLFIYLFWLVSEGYKKREKLLSNQLKLEAKDKQFLLARVNEVLASGNS